MRDSGTEGQSPKMCEKSIFLARDRGTMKHGSKSVKYSFIWARDTGTEGQTTFFGPKS